MGRGKNAALSLNGLRWGNPGRFNNLWNEKVEQRFKIEHRKGGEGRSREGRRKARGEKRLALSTPLQGE